MQNSIRIGTRGSRLALYQAELVDRQIRRAFPSLQVEIIPIKTSGDVTAVRGRDPMETKRIFTKEIESALLAGDVDMAVHSAKDTAVDLPAGTCIGAVLAAEDNRDCLLTTDGAKLKGLPSGARIGTSSLRRQKQVLRFRPDLQVEALAGNVETRIRRMTEGQFAGIILAYAGLRRLGLLEHVSEIFDPETFYPAPGQGIILVQCREEDVGVRRMLDAIHHWESGIQLLCERAFLRRLEGGCQLPCGIWTRLEGGMIRAGGVLFDLEGGGGCVEGRSEGSMEEAEETGRRLAERILAAGGSEIMEKLRRSRK